MVDPVRLLPKLIVVLSLIAFGAAWLLFGRQQNPQPVLESLTYSDADSSQLISPHELLRWEGQGSLRIRGLQYLPRLDDWWLSLDFGKIALEPFQMPAAGRFIKEFRLDPKDGLRLDLRLSSGHVRAVAHPKLKRTLVLIDPPAMRAQWEAAMSRGDWAKSNVVLGEVSLLGPSNLGFSSAEIHDLRLESLLGEGRQAFEGQDYELASEALLRYVEERPELQPRLMLSRAYSLGGDSARSLQMLADLKREYPTLPQVSYAIGLTMMSDRRYKEAIVEFERAASAARLSGSEEALDPKLYCFLGTCYYEKYLSHSSQAETTAKRQDLESSRSYLRRFVEIQGADDADRRIALSTLKSVEAAIEEAEGRLRVQEQASQALPQGQGPQASAEPVESAEPAAPDTAPAPTPVMSSHLSFEPPDLSDFKGRFLLVHFWASWCLPCREEMPGVREFFETAFPQFEKGGMQFITVSNDFRDIDFLNYAREKDLRFPIYFDPSRQLQRRLGLGEDLPLTLLLDRQGKPLASWIGKIDWLGESFFNTMKSHIAEE